MIEAKQTYYKGTFYRSRLEARWVIFFEALGIQHKYEPELIDLGLKHQYWTEDDDIALRFELGETGMYSAEEIARRVDFEKNARLMYRPDFWLPGYMHWFEAKGMQPTMEEIRKARLLAYRFGHPVNILHGTIPENVAEMAKHNLVYQSDITVTQLLLIKYGTEAITHALQTARQARFEQEVTQ